MAADPVKRANFVVSAVEFVQQHGFDGLDMDWEYPADHDRDNFSLLIAELKAALSPHGLLLTAALGSSYEQVPISYDLAELSRHLDLMNIMTYDFHGFWSEHEQYTGHNAPLISTEEEHSDETHPGYMFNVYDAMMQFAEDPAVDKSKLVLGIPLYGRGFELIDSVRVYFSHAIEIPDHTYTFFQNNNGIYCPTDAALPTGPYTLVPGYWGYLEILQAKYNDTLFNLPEAKPGQWADVVDACYQAPYMSKISRMLKIF